MTPPEQDLIQLIYISTMPKPLTSEELEGILAASRKNNKALNVTGLLIIKGNKFMQALEGESRHVKALYDKIAQDPRHAGVVMMSEMKIKKRDFPNWEMGFKNLDRLPRVDSKKLTDFGNTDMTSKEFTENPKMVHMLFKSFIEKVT